MLLLRQYKQNDTKIDGQFYPIGRVDAWQGKEKQYLSGIWGLWSFSKYSLTSDRRIHWIKFCNVIFEAFYTFCNVKGLCKMMLIAVIHFNQIIFALLYFCINIYVFLKIAVLISSQRIVIKESTYLLEQRIHIDLCIKPVWPYT